MRGWSYYTIPTMVFVVNSVIIGFFMNVRFDPSVVFLSFLLINLYSFGLATLSGKREKFLIVFVPWVFFGPVVMFFKNVALGTFAVFVISLFVEWRVFQNVDLRVASVRIAAVSLLTWEMKAWLRDFVVLSRITGGF